MRCSLRADARKKHHVNSHTPEFANERKYIQQSPVERMFLSKLIPPIA